MGDWRWELLVRLGAQPTSLKLKALDLWARSESMPTRLHNPLAAGELNPATGRWLGDHNIISYPTIEAAVYDYHKLLQTKWFLGIGLELRTSGNLFNIWASINASNWREPGFQSGRYPVMMYRLAATPPAAPRGPEPLLEKLDPDLYKAWRRLNLELTKTMPRQIARVRAWTARLHSAVR